MGLRWGQMTFRFEQAFMARLTTFFSWLARRLSLRTCRAIADRFADLIILLTGHRQRLADANIAASFPDMTPEERRRVRIASVRNISRTMVELLKLPSISKEELAELVPLDAGPMMREITKERGIILLTGHYGNWEWLGARLAQEVPTTVIARDAAHNVTSGIINQSRESHGEKVIGRDDLRRMLTVLRNKELLGILPDQHALSGGIKTDFLGRTAWSFTGPALLAARTGAVVLPMFSVRQPDNTFKVEVMPLLELVETGDRDADIATNTQIILDAVCDAIRRHPEQWLWLHNRWKTNRMKAAEEAAASAVE